MKTKVIILVVVAAIMVSFTVVNQSKKQTVNSKSVSSTNGRYMDDKNQFN
jgi:hypothetical protein